VCLSTVLGLDDRPAEIAGWGPVAPDLARRTLESVPTAEWRIVIVDDDGHLLHIDLTRRRPRPDPQHPPPRHPMTCAVVELAVPLSWIRALDPADHGRWAGVLVRREPHRRRPVDRRRGVPRRRPPTVPEGGPRAVGAGARPVVRRARVPASCARLRSRPHPRPPRRGPDPGRQPQRRVSSRPPHEAPRWLDPDPTRGGRTLLAFAQRCPLRRPAPPRGPPSPQPGAPGVRDERPAGGRLPVVRGRLRTEHPVAPGLGQRPHPVPVPVPVPTSCAAAGYDDVPPF